MRETAKIWMNGELVDWGDAKVHVGTHGLHYGSGVFEGIRAYDTPKGTAVFRLTDHLARLHNSARLIYMELPYSVEELRSASMELLGVNGLPEAYLRPIAFYGYGELGVYPGENPVDVVIMSWPWGAYLGDDALERGRPREGVLVEARRAEHDPARVEGDRHLPELDARRPRGAEGRLRGGDPPHGRGLRRRRLRREHLRGQERRDLHARPLGLDPARHHARLRDPDRPGSRLSRSSRRP